MEAQLRRALRALEERATEELDCSPIEWEGQGSEVQGNREVGHVIRIAPDPAAVAADHPGP